VESGGEAHETTPPVLGPGDESGADEYVPFTFEEPPGLERYRTRRVELAGDPHFPPVENGLDYLVSVVEHLESPDGEVSARNLKYAVLHLAAGAEVLLKARLQYEHWSLVFAHPGTATRQALADGSLSSCTPDETRQRLTNILGINFSARETKALSELARARNALQHYGLVGERADAHFVEATTAQVLNFLIGFLDVHLLPELSTQERDEAEIAMERIRGGLHMIQSYAAERMRDLAPKLGPVRARTVRCPDCFQWALSPAPGGDDGCTMICHFCGRAMAPDEAALGYTFYVVKRGQSMWDADESWVPGHCPDCRKQCLVEEAATVAAPDTAVDFCFNCATPIEGHTRCQRCGYRYRPNTQEHICPFVRSPP
jgi:hypothetical protein